MNLPELPEPIEEEIELEDGVAFVTMKYVSKEQLQAYGKACAEAMREACAAECEARYMGDNNREDMEARRCADVIRALEIEE